MHCFGNTSLLELISIVTCMSTKEELYDVQMAFTKTLHHNTTTLNT